MSPELLYPMVTEAIRRAETLGDLGAPGAAAAFLDVSLLEEKIAGTLPVTDPEGAIARRGAVRAALSAGEFGRARHLIERYLADQEGDETLRSALIEFSQQVDASEAAHRAEARDLQGILDPSQVKVLEEAVVNLRQATGEVLKLTRRFAVGKKEMDRLLVTQSDFIDTAVRLMDQSKGVLRSQRHDRA